MYVHNFVIANKSTVIELHYHALLIHVFRISPWWTIRPSGRFRRILIIASPRFLRLGKLKLKQGRVVSNNIKRKQPTQSSSSAKRRRANAAAASVGFSIHPNNHQGLVITMRWWERKWMHEKKKKSWNKLANVLISEGGASDIKVRIRPKWMTSASTGS